MKRPEENLPQLHVNVETVQEISPKCQAIYRSQHSMNPPWKRQKLYQSFKFMITKIWNKTKKSYYTCRYKQSVSLFDRASITHIDLVAEEHLILTGWRTPSLE